MIMKFTTHFPKLLLVILCTLAPASSWKATAADHPVQQKVFVAGDDGYHTFRIPAIVTTTQGTLLAFCEGRKNNRRDHGDIDLVMKRSEDFGRTWSPLTLVHEEGGTKEITIGNPCPVVDQKTGVVWLTFTRNNDDVFVTHSDDDGRTWSEPRRITDTVKESDWTWYATGPGVGIQTTRGRLVIPCDHREPYQDKTTKMSHVFYSDDHGKSWQLGGTVAPYTDECQVAELTDGRLMINMRNYWAREGGRPERGGMRAVAWSQDGGESWSELDFDSTLIEPVCQASLIRYSGLRHSGKSRLLFSNPASKDNRVRMTVRLSYDEGETWPVHKLLHEGPSAYSCLVRLPDGAVGCLYEQGRDHPYETITFARFPIDWLE
jgi:sialidase-1